MSLLALHHRFAAAFIVLVALVFLLLLPRAPMLDALVRYEDLCRVLNGQKTEQKFSMVGPLGATPLYYLGKYLGDTERWVSYYNRLVIVAGCIGFWWLLRPLLTAAERVRFIVALAMTSTLPHHLLFFGGEPFTCVVVSLGLAATVLRRAWWGMPLAIAGTVNLPGTVGALGLASLVLVARTRRLRFLLAAPVAFGLWILENYIRRGDGLFSGYDGDHGIPTALPYSGLPEFSYPLFFGLLSVLLSFGKGLVFFIPALFLSLPAEPDRPNDADLTWVYWVWLGYMAGLILVYSKWWCWYGGWFWGPRFFVFGCFPAALVVARRTVAVERFSTAANLLMLLVLTLSAWVAVNGVVYKDTGLTQYLKDNFALECFVWYVPECSGLWWPFVTPMSLTSSDWWRIAAVTAGFCYLAVPVVNVLARRIPGHIAAMWRTVRAGGPFRL